MESNEISEESKELLSIYHKTFDDDRVSSKVYFNRCNTCVLSKIIVQCVSVFLLTSNLNVYQQKTRIVFYEVTLVEARLSCMVGIRKGRGEVPHSSCIPKIPFLFPL